MPESIVVIFWLGVCLFLIFKQKKFQATGISKYWNAAAFLFMVLLGFSNYYIWMHVIGHGDSLRYYHDSLLVYNTLFDHPSDFFRLLTGYREGTVPEHLTYITTKLEIEWHVAEYNMVRILAVLNIFSFGSAWGNIVILSFLSFITSISLFNLLQKKIEQGGFHRLLFAVMFFVPGIVFWRSGLLKEGPAYLLLSIIMIQLLLLEVTSSLKHWFILLISILLLWMIRDYTAGLLLIHLVIWMMVMYVKPLRRFPVATFIGCWTLLLTPVIILSASDQDLNFTKHLQSEQSYFLTGPADPDYNFQLLDGSFMDIVRKIPYSLNNVLFRPNLIHSTTTFRIYQSIELILVILTLCYFFFRFHRVRLASPSLLLFVFLSMILLMVFGVMVTDADTLSRYRSIPLQFLLIIAVARAGSSYTLEK